MADLAARTGDGADSSRRRSRRHAGRVVGLGYSNGANILAERDLRASPRCSTPAVLMHPLIPFEPRAGAAAGRRC